MQNNNILSAEQEARNYIESLELSQEQLKMIKAMHVLIQIYTRSNREYMEKRFDDFEVSLKRYFEKMIGDHRGAMDDVLNKFLGEWYTKNMVPAKLNISMKNLIERIKYMKRGL
jgi:hypothetical protein